MANTALKSSLHAILDRIENEQLLRSVHDFLVEHEQAKEGQIWRTLTEEQKHDVLASYAESEDEQNLLSWKELKAKY
jgi:outer membrane PBP1 activator LpoA protein